MVHCRKILTIAVCFGLFACSRAEDQDDDGKDQPVPVEVPSPTTSIKGTHNYDVARSECPYADSYVRVLTDRDTGNADLFLLNFGLGLNGYEDLVQHPALGGGDLCAWALQEHQLGAQMTSAAVEALVSRQVAYGSSCEVSGDATGWPKLPKGFRVFRKNDETYAFLVEGLDPAVAWYDLDPTPALVTAFINTYSSEPVVFTVGYSGATRTVSCLVNWAK